MTTSLNDRLAPSAGIAISERIFFLLVVSSVLLLLLLVLVLLLVLSDEFPRIGI